TFNTDANLPGTGQAVVYFEDMVSGDVDSVHFEVSTQTSPAFALNIIDSVKTGPANSNYTLVTYMKNLTEEQMDVKVTRLVNELPEGWSSSLCAGETCYAPFVEEYTDSIAVNDSLEFKITFNTSNDKADTGRVFILFEDMNTGQKDSLEYVVRTHPLVNFNVVFNDTIAEGSAGSELIVDGYIHNPGQDSISIGVHRLSNEIPAQWTSSICFDVCFAPFIDSVTETIAGNDSLEFSFHFFTDSTARSGQALLAITAEGNTDTVKQMVTASTYTTGLVNPADITERSFRLLGNYPNPFNPTTIIRFKVPEAAKHSTFRIFTLDGRQVTSKEMGPFAAGLQFIPFNVSQSPRAGLASGSYFYTITLTGKSGQVYTGNGKFTLIK
ncbi:MAG: T9SS type A sorting domain-containing protein, partial [Caldithrix sp.]|nr:T9SS type A sorting domain-containing protein [Caldithrix sp.]